MRVWLRRRPSTPDGWWWRRRQRRWSRRWRRWGGNTPLSPPVTMPESQRRRYWPCCTSWASSEMCASGTRSFTARLFSSSLRRPGLNSSKLTVFQSSLSRTSRQSSLPFRTSTRPSWTKNRAHLPGKPPGLFFRASAPTMRIVFVSPHKMW